MGAKMVMPQNMARPSSPFWDTHGCYALSHKAFKASSGSYLSSLSTWEWGKFLRTHNANDTRRVPANRSLLPENVTPCLRTAPPAHAR